MFVDFDYSNFFLNGVVTPFFKFTRNNSSGVNFVFSFGTANASTFNSFLHNFKCLVC